MPKRTRSRPKVAKPARAPPRGLGPETIANDERLSAAVDAVVHSNDAGRARHRELLVLHDRLRPKVDAAAWALFLTIDAATNARWSELTLVLARWAFSEGVRGGRRRARGERRG